tara:strand:+ start:569 stop:1546 length:978 start_codon:yes stop_codon:yes gene_type:complete
MQLEQITVHAIRRYSGLDETSVESYYHGQNNLIPLLRDVIIKPFEEQLKNTTGYNGENLPVGPQETEMELGPVTFTITSKQRTKRPKLADVYDGVHDFLGFIKESYESGVRRKGVVTMENAGFIALDVVTKKVAELYSDVHVPEVTHSIKYTDARGPPAEPNSVMVPIANGVSLTPGDAVLYVNAKILSNAVKKNTIDPLDKALKAETGYSKSKVPDETEHKWTQVGHHLLRTQTVPEDTVSYGKIMDSLMKEAPQKITKRSVVGDLVRLRDNLPLEDAEAMYQPTTKRRKLYISIDGALQRLDQLKDLHTIPSVNQSVKHYPVV